MKDDIYKDLNKKIIPKTIENQEIEITMEDQTDDLKKIEGLKENIAEMQKETEEIEKNVKNKQTIKVQIPEIHKVTVLNPPDPIIIPEETTIKNVEEIGKEIAKNIPSYIPPEINIPDQITVKNMPNFPDIPEYPKSMKIDNLEDLLQIGDKPGKADPTRYIPVRMTNGKNFVNELAGSYVAASKAVFPYVNMNSGKPQPAAVDNLGVVQTNAGSSTGITTISGQTQGVYYSTPPTLTQAQLYTLLLDANANLKITQATNIAGEDLTANVLKVEQRFSYATVTADTAVKSGAGFLHSITIIPNDAAPTAGSIILYDNTAESGTKILDFSGISTTWFAPVTLILDVSFSTGLYVGYTTTADVNCTIAYR